MSQMKLGIVAEFYDRATKSMNKMLRFNKKLEKSAKTQTKLAKSHSRSIDKSARAQSKLTRSINATGRAARATYRAIGRGAKQAARSVAALHRKTVKLAKYGVGNIKSGSQKVLRGLKLSAAVATIVIGTSILAAGQLVDTAAKFEKYQTILETTERSSLKAKTAMAWVTEFAVKTPYELDQVMESFVRLRTYGLDPTNGMLKTLGDTSAAMGKPLMQSVEAIADAMTGENERLKEFGIKAAKTGKKITYEYTNALGKTVHASVEAGNRMAIQQTLMRIWGDKFGGAMQKLSQTWTGMVSNLADQWMKFQLMIMNSGLFDWMKSKLQGVLDKINKMEADGTLKYWAVNIGNSIKSVLENTWTFATKTYEVIKKLSGYLQKAADYVGGWENLGLVLAGFTFGPVLVATAAGLVQIATGLAALGAALMANPIAIAIGVLVGGAWLIWKNWEPIKKFFVDLWGSISSGASRAWAALKSTFESLNPAAVLSGIWKGAKTAVANVMAGIGDVVAGSWEKVKTILSWHPAVLIVKNWSTIGDAARSAINTAYDAVKNIWGKITTLFNWQLPPEFATAFERAFSAVTNAVEKAWETLKRIFGEIKTAVSDLANMVGSVFGTALEKASAAWENVKSVFSFGEAKLKIADPASIKAAQKATATLKTDLQAVSNIDTSKAMTKLVALREAGGKIQTALESSIRRAQAYLSNVSFYSHGAALMDTLAAGIRARSQAVITEVQKVTQAMRDHLPSSPAKIGPLSDIHKLRFGETIAASIRAAPMVKAMRAATLATLAAASPAMAAPHVVKPSQAALSAPASGTSPSAISGSGVTIQFSPTITVGAGASITPEQVRKIMREQADELVRMIEKKQKQNSRLDF